MFNNRYFLRAVRRARFVDPPAAPVTEEVELQGGVKSQMTPENAAIYKAARAKDREQREAMAITVNQYKVEKAAAEQARLDAETLLAAEKAAKANDQAELKKLYSKESAEKFSRLSRTTINAELAGVASRLFPGVDKVIIDDIVAGNASRLGLDPETLTVRVLSEAGQPATDAEGRPLGVDALLTEYASKRKYLQSAQAPAKDGKGLGQGKAAAGSPDKITFAEQQKMMHDGTWKTSGAEKRYNAGKLILDG